MPDHNWESSESSGSNWNGGIFSQIVIFVFAVFFFSVWYGIFIFMAYKIGHDWWEMKQLSQESGSDTHATIRHKEMQTIPQKEGTSHKFVVDYDFEAVRNDGMKVHVSVKGRQVSFELYGHLEVGQMEPVRFMAKAPQHCRLEKVMSEHDRDEIPAWMSVCGFLGLLVIYVIFLGAPLIVPFSIYTGWDGSLSNPSFSNDAGSSDGVHADQADSDSGSGLGLDPGTIVLVIFGLLCWIAGTTLVVCLFLPNMHDSDFTVLKPGSKSRSVNLEELGHEDLDSYGSESLSDSDDL